MTQFHLFGDIDFTMKHPQFNISHNMIPNNGTSFNLFSPIDFISKFIEVLQELFNQMVNAYI